MTVLGAALLGLAQCMGAALALMVYYLLLNANGVLHVVPEAALDNFIKTEVIPAKPGAVTGNEKWNLEVLCKDGVKGNSDKKKIAYGWRNLAKEISVPWIENESGQKMYVFGELAEFVILIHPRGPELSAAQIKTQVKELQKLLPPWPEGATPKPSYHGWRLVPAPERLPWCRSARKRY